MLPLLQSASPSPDHPLLPAPGTSLDDLPASYSLKQQHSITQAAITLIVPQQRPGLISIENEYDDHIIPSPTRQDLRRNYVSFRIWAACQIMTCGISHAGVAFRDVFLLNPEGHTSPCHCCGYNQLGYSRRGCVLQSVLKFRPFLWVFFSGSPDIQSVSLRCGEDTGLDGK